MPTVINNPPQSDSSSGMSGVIVGVVIAAILAFIFFAYALPAMRGSRQNSGTTINVPEKVDIDVNKTNN